jgi:hypothetical protein
VPGHDLCSSGLGWNVLFTFIVRLEFSTESTAEHFAMPSKIKLSIKNISTSDASIKKQILLGGIVLRGQ